MTKTQHEMLKEICDLIWYKDIFKMHDNLYRETYREIIFTQDFMEKLNEILTEENWQLWAKIFTWLLLKNLHDPVTYLYKALWLWEK